MAVPIPFTVSHTQSDTCVWMHVCEKLGPRQALPLCTPGAHNKASGALRSQNPAQQRGMGPITLCRALRSAAGFLKPNSLNSGHCSLLTLHLSELSWSPFPPFSRLSLSAALTHNPAPNLCQVCVHLPIPHTPSAQPMAAASPYTHCG